MSKNEKMNSKPIATKTDNIEVKKITDTSMIKKKPKRKKFKKLMAEITRGTPEEHKKIDKNSLLINLGGGTFQKMEKIL